jgi:hypothetical protein
VCARGVLGGPTRVGGGADIGAAHVAAGEIVMFDGLISVYRNAIDVFFYVVGAAKENELLLAHVLSSLMEALALLFRSVDVNRGRGGARG